MNPNNEMVLNDCFLAKNKNHSLLSVDELYVFYVAARDTLNDELLHAHKQTVVIV